MHSVGCHVYDANSGTILKTNNLNNIWGLDENNYVIAESGVTMGQLLPWLEERGRLLEWYATIADVTVGGITVQATKDSNPTFTRSAADSVRKIEYVDGDGILRNVTNSYGADNIIQNNYGRTGIVYRVWLNTVPLQHECVNMKFQDLTLDNLTAMKDRVAFGRIEDNGGVNIEAYLMIKAEGSSPFLATETMRYCNETLSLQSLYREIRLDYWNGDWKMLAANPAISFLWGRDIKVVRMPSDKQINHDNLHVGENAVEVLEQFHYVRFDVKYFDDIARDLLALLEIIPYEELPTAFYITFHAKDYAKAHTSLPGENVELAFAFDPVWTTADNNPQAIENFVRLYQDITERYNGIWEWNQSIYLDDMPLPQVQAHSRFAGPSYGTSVPK